MVHASSLQRIALSVANSQRRLLGYSALSPYNLHGHWGSAGFNTAGVGNERYGEYLQ